MTLDPDGGLDLILQHPKSNMWLPFAVLLPISVIGLASVAAIVSQSGTSREPGFWMVIVGALALLDLTLLSLAFGLWMATGPLASHRIRVNRAGKAVVASKYAIFEGTPRHLSLAPEAARCIPHPNGMGSLLLPCTTADSRSADSPVALFYGSRFTQQECEWLASVLRQASAER